MKNQSFFSTFKYNIFLSDKLLQLMPLKDLLQNDQYINVHVFNEGKYVVFSEYIHVY